MVNYWFETVPYNNCCVASQSSEKKTVPPWTRMRREQYSTCRKAPFPPPALRHLHQARFVRKALASHAV